jgi:hypothetical protein
MNMAQAGERRWQRYPVDVRLKVSVQDNGRTNSVFGRSSSLSEGGMGAYIPWEIPLGATIVLSLLLPTVTSEVTISAMVRNAEGFRYGLEFLRLPESARSLIVSLCAASVARS